MHSKASFFQDDTKARDILETNNPKTAKALGRQVTNFDKTRWYQVCDEIMKEALVAKFTQNPPLKKGHRRLSICGSQS